MPEFSENNTKRALINYKNCSENFINTSKDYTKQYCSIYVTRLNQFRPLLEERTKLKWDSKYPLFELHKLSEVNCKCVVFGTLFKDQKLKPSILKQLAEINQLVPQPVLNHFTEENDTLFIEDGLERYQILGAIDKNFLVTGITCALLGTVIGNGKFEVADYTFAGPQVQVERPIFNDDAYIVFLSGLDLINYEKSSVFLNIFIYWLSGLINMDSCIESQKISRVIIAGNSLKTVQDKVETKISMTSRVTESAETIEAVKIFDDFLEKLARIIEVDVMPGENDPSNHIIPQQPLHHCLFPESFKYKSLNLTPNPYKFSLGNMEILGTSGQNVRDIMRYSEIQNGIDVLEKCLEWGHIAPTAPDTLGCFPFYDKDPFILNSTPHVFFAGNQETFDTKLTSGAENQNVRLICVPDFANSAQIILLNLKNLECFPVAFS